MKPFENSEKNKAYVTLRLMVQRAARKAAMGGSKATGERRTTEGARPYREESRPQGVEAVHGQDPMEYFYDCCAEQTRRFQAEATAEQLRQSLVAALRENAELRRENDKLRAEMQVRELEAARG